MKKRKRIVQVTEVEQRVVLAFQELARKMPGTKIDGYHVCAHTGLGLEAVNDAIKGLMAKNLLQRTSRTTRQ